MHRMNASVNKCEVVKVFDIKSTAKSVAVFQKLIVVAVMAEMP